MSRQRTLIAIAAIGLIAMLGRQSGASDLSVERVRWGETPNGAAVTLFTLHGRGGLIVRLSDYGATWVSADAPDRAGMSANVLLGFPDLDGYLKHGATGATVGRFANRIAGGRFTLDGKEYALATNAGPNHLHGGGKGFDKFVWKAEAVSDKDGPSVRFTRQSPDGEEGYPGNVDVSVTYTVTPENAVRIDYVATTDKPTPLNLTNHAYFNLAGTGRPKVEPVLGHVLTVHADRYLPVNNTRIPTGEIAPVEGTPMDFRQPLPIGDRIELVGGPKVKGYDHCYAINSGGQGKLVPVALVTEPKSGRTLDVSSTEPGVQFYTANFLRGEARHTGFCLETQHFPDSPNQPNFPNTILRPGETFRSTTVYRFGVAP